MEMDLWTYPAQPVDPTDLTGFTVRATDGDIGKVDEATYDVGASYVVVDTGPWIFGQKVLIPAGTIRRVNLEDRELWLALTKAEIKGSPEFDPNGYDSDAYRSSVSTYYRG